MAGIASKKSAVVGPFAVSTDPSVVMSANPPVVKSPNPPVVVSANPSNYEPRVPAAIVVAVLILASLSRLISPQAGFGVLAALALLHAAAHPQEFLRARVSLLLVSFAVLGLASVAWSVDRGTTIHRMPAFLSFYIIAALVGPALGVERLSVIFTRMTRIFTVIALVAGFAFPEWAKDPGIPGETGWASIVASKNYLGLLGVLCFACAVLAPKARFRVPWALISVLLVVQSRSATSMALVVITLVTALFSSVLVRLGSVQKKRVVIAIMGTIGAAFTASVFLDATFAAGLLGRDKTLTGRTAIWDFVLDRIWQKPWLGHGYMSYWNVENEFTINVKRIVGFPVTSAHQATLDILLSLGVIGATLMVLLLATAILRTFGDRSVPGRVPVRAEHLRWARGIVLIYAIETFSESCLTTVFVVPLLIVVAAITSETIFFRHRYK